VGFIKTGISAIGKLVLVAVLAGTFLAGMIGVVFLSLRGEEVKVPEVVGKDFSESEKEIAGLGLKIKRRATRYSQEKPNTVLEQLPKPGETVKTGQTILVVLSEANPEGSEAPATLKKENAADEEESTDVTPDKTVKTNKNSNVKKPSQTTRDVVSNKSNKNANAADSDSANANSSKSNSGDANKNAGNKNSSPNQVNKPAAPAANKPDAAKPNVTKPPTAAKTPTSGDTRTRKIP
jgi:beta-lactam-binding protein with PASTA domain